MYNLKELLVFAVHKKHSDNIQGLAKLKQVGMIGEARYAEEYMREHWNLVDSLRFIDTLDLSAPEEETPESKYNRF